MQKNSSIWSSGTTSITLNVQSATKNTKKMVNQTNQKMTNKEITYFNIFLCEINNSFLLSKTTYIYFLREKTLLIFWDFVSIQ